MSRIRQTRVFTGTLPALKCAGHLGVRRNALSARVEDDRRVVPSSGGRIADDGAADEADADVPRCGRHHPLTHAPRLLRIVFARECGCRRPGVQRNLGEHGKVCARAARVAKARTKPLLRVIRKERVAYQCDREGHEA